MKKSVVLIAVLSVAIAVCALFAACAHEHSLQHFEAKAPTCVAEGNIEYWYCADCDKYFSDETADTEITKDKTVLAATGEHSWGVWTAGEGESCETGGTRSHSCTICGLTETETFAAGSHQLKYIAEVPSTCKKAGTMAHWHCDICGKNFGDENASQLLSDLSLPLGSHNIVDGKCTVCGFTQSVAGTPGLEYTLNVDGTGYTATGLGTATETDIVIASEYNGLPVTAVGEWFGSISNITSVYIPGSVKTIMNHAFSNCDKLKSVIIDEGVTTIGAGAFFVEGDWDTGSLSELRLPNTLKTIGAQAFTQAAPPKTLELRIPKNVTGIGEGFFWGCDLKSIVVDEGNTAYQSRDNCLIETATKKLILGCGSSIIPSDGSATSIGYAFGQCNTLISITIPEGVTNIGDGAFYDCWSLTSITIPHSVTSIGEYAFEGCDALTIYCEASSKPSGWTSGWEESCPVVWDCNNNDVADDGNIYYISEDNIRYALKDGEAAIAKQSTALSGKIVLPESIDYNGNTYNVTSMEYGAFKRCNLLGNIAIPDSITSISNSAFAGCNSLTSITIPDSIINIGKEAFWDCSSLTSITIPDSVTSIGEGAFVYCNSLTIYCEASSKPSGWIYNWNDSDWLNSSFGHTKCPVVWNCNSNNVADDGAVYYIYNGIRYAYKDGAVAVAGQPTILSGKITLPESVVYNGNTYNVTSIGERAFYGCESLTSITISSKITSIGKCAFFECTSFTSINIPDSVTSIGDYAFYKCSSLKSIIIPDSVTSIGERAFYGTNLIQKENGVSYVDRWVVDCDSSLKQVQLRDNTVGIASGAFSGYSGLTSIIIPDSVTSIGDDAFNGCTSLTSITISDSVISIGQNAFLGCSSIKEVYISDIAAWCAIEFESYSANPLYNGAELYLNGERVTSLEIPEGVISIGDYTFYNYTSLASIMMPDSVTHIGNYAFYECSSLTSITIPDSVISIGEGAFYYCTLLKSVVIPDSVTSIGLGAFADCSSLASITVEQGNPIYHSSGNCIIETKSKTLIAGCNNSIIPNDGSVTIIGDGAFYDCNSLTSIVIPEGVTSIGAGAFGGCSSLTSITIPDSVTSIGDAFYNCSSLNEVYISDIAAWCAIDFESSSANPLYNGAELYLNGELVTALEIPEGVTSIGEWAFYNFDSLTSITISNSVTNIGGYAFYGCDSLESITVEQGNPIYHSAGNCIIETKSKTLIVGCKNSVIPADGSVTSIGDYAFRSCNSLTSITIPDSVTDIGKYAFYNCSSLKTVTIGNGVTSIGDYAFSEYRSLTSINFQGTMAEWKAIDKGYGWNFSLFGFGSFTITCTDGTLDKNGNEIQ